MAWQVYLALVARMNRFGARRLHHAMTAHLWALQAQHETGAAGELARVEALAFPNSSADGGLALKQSS